ncbi:hypothetical protein [Ochrobactrum sp. A-1]|uniref:hypothetical protein n=1 Tax=Ochrobactrum sp. A-1 TaxID=2920940 RepID=UPI001F0B5F14|nr:hypothetical protein [Ochrobactrum sp. A-1]
MKQVHFFDIDTIMATIEADNDGLLAKAIAASGNDRQKRSLTAQHDFMQIAMLIVRKVLQSWNNELTEKEIGQALGHALGNGIGFLSEIVTTDPQLSRCLRHFPGRATLLPLAIFPMEPLVRRWNLSR